MWAGAEEWRHFLVTMSLCLPRMAAAFMVIPVLSRQILPGLVRNGVMIGYALFLFPVVEPTVPATLPNTWIVVAVVMKETFLGLGIGYSAAIVLWAIEATGFFIDNQRGATMSSSLNPMSGEQTSPLGILLSQLILVLFLTSGLFTQFLIMLFTSYKIWPVWSFFPVLNPGAPMLFLKGMDNLMGLTVLLSAPVFIVMFLSEMGLALVSRFAPQLQVFFLAMPVKSAVGLFMLILYLSAFVDYVFRHLDVLTQIPSLMGQW